MGISGNNGQGPQFSTHPTGTPAELREMGFDLGEVRSCAVRKKDNEGKAVVLGCPYAKDKCPRLFDGRNPRIGDFSPKEDDPDAGGQGPRNVPFYLKTTEGNELESYMPCHMFIASVYPRMLMARHPETPSGETVRILGVESTTPENLDGARIVVTESLPVDPGNPKNIRLKHETFALRTPHHPRPKDLDARWKEKMLRDRADAIESAADFGPVTGDIAEIDVASDEPAPAVAAVVESTEPATAAAEPIRRGKPRA